ncbi:extracellular solute-binding protein [Paenibacillus sp. PR3]|uniref:Extracellular solute-binding protein n=1 Tax=Paenibacillus terricola TaxID=2763503 RepID=A0ABR8MVK2_9BACL|nr:extracellular solute-binding protein [Paenibacillus terricola]MBD3919938.1 extracellular solute-binding protein [Paenibacillus terricola]
MEARRNSWGSAASNRNRKLLFSPKLMRLDGSRMKNNKLLMHAAKLIPSFTALLLLMTLLSSCTSAEEQQAKTLATGEEIETLTIQLLSWRPLDVADSNRNNPLALRIKQFQELHPNVHLTFLWNDTHGTPSKWANEAESYKHANPYEVPDLVELAPNQMRLWYQYGIIEPLPMNETDLSKSIISSSEGHVLGVKIKNNPLIMYYNKDTFLSLGLDPPTSEWDLDKLNDTITKLKAARQNVYLPLSPYTLEWVTSMNNGHIAGTDGTSFAGYLDSPQAVKAAEWIAGIGTKLEDYKLRSIGPIETYIPVPYDLLEGRIALAVDFAYGFNVGGLNTYEEIAQQDERIGISALPRGLNGVNPAQISGLSMTAKSRHKVLAMELMRYLTADPSSIDSQIAANTMQSNLTYPLKEAANDERYSIVLQEIKRSVPAALYMYNAIGSSQRDFMYDQPRTYSAIRGGVPVPDALKVYADSLDLDFNKFKHEPAEYDACIQSWFRYYYSESCVQ